MTEVEAAALEWHNARIECLNTLERTPFSLTKPSKEREDALKRLGKAECDLRDRVKEMISRNGVT